MTNYDKRLLFAVLIIVCCFLYMALTEGNQEFCKSVIFVVVTFFFGSSDKKGKDDFGKRT